MSHDLTPGDPQTALAAQWLVQQRWPIPAEALGLLLSCLREHDDACACLARARRRRRSPRLTAFAAGLPKAGD